MAAEHQVPATMLKQAAALIHSGHTQTGAGIAYQAALVAIQEAATRNGYPCANREQVLAFLDAVDNTNTSPITASALPTGMTAPAADALTDRLPIAFADFSVAEALKAHAETPLAIQRADPVQFGQPETVKHAIPVLQELIALLAKANLK